MIFLKNEMLYSGFYTQAEVREIVACAAERYINVVPEIDMPGHMLGALASYGSTLRNSVVSFLQKGL